MKRILFISHIGTNKNKVPNGVNVKNIHILKYLKKMKDIEVSVIDTVNWKVRLIPLFICILVESIKSEKIILSINTSSAYKVINFLKILNLEHKVIYIVVGGSLHKQINNGNLKIETFEKVHKIVVQTKSMENSLNNIGLRNVIQMNNSKYFKDIKVDYDRNPEKPIKCFYLGRIHPDKGVDMVFEAIKKLNVNVEKLKIDFYGPIEKKYKEVFLGKVNNCPSANYKGVINFVDNEESYFKLSKYDLFLFPTYWSGEGFPGVIIDSFIAGVPVLASDWNHNKEVIDGGRNGIIFKSKDVEDFIYSINLIIEEPCILKKMRKNAHTESKKYKSENVFKVLEDLI